MTKEEFLLELLLENHPVKCKHYQGDEEECEKGTDLLKLEGGLFLACNCEGNTQDCDLFEELERKLSSDNV